MLRPLSWRRMVMAQGKDAMAQGVEHGFVICGGKGLELARGPESSGHRYGVSLTVHCRQGRPLAAFHTHPGGSPEPSSLDIESARKFRIPWLCIGVPETGVIKCHRVSPKR